MNGKCSSTNYVTQNACVAAKKTWKPANHSTWNGCVTDRGLPITNGPDIPSAGNYDENVNPPVAGNLATLYPAFQAPSCPQAAIGLNYDWSAMTTGVNNMPPGGSTDQPIGLVWGWQTLVGGGQKQPRPAVAAAFCIRGKWFPAPHRQIAGGQSKSPTNRAGLYLRR
jgi:hypothetical protein